MFRNPLCRFQWAVASVCSHQTLLGAWRRFGWAVVWWFRGGWRPGASWRGCGAALSLGRDRGGGFRSDAIGCGFGRSLIVGGGGGS